MSIFKAYDIRGVFGEELTAGLVRRIGRGMSTMLRERLGGDEAPVVVVGGDIRNSTEIVRAELVNGLTAGGCKVIDIGTVPTPVYYYACRLIDPDAAAMITASHNPPEFNGLKVALDRDPITPEKIQALADVVEDGRFVDGSGSVTERDVWDGYHRWLAEEFPDGFALKVVADAGNGAWSSHVGDVLRRLGFEVVELFCEPDGNFPNRPSDPSKVQSISALREKVRETGADIGVAFDGDGDRACFVDENGEAIDKDKILVALAREVLAGCDDPAKECVVHDSICSLLVADAIRSMGARPVIERVGYTFIRRRVLQENALFGGELSGHFFYRKLNANDDGMYSFLRCARMIGGAGKPLSTILEDIPTANATPALRVPCSQDEGEAILDAIAAQADDACDVSRMDGVRVDYPDGWGLARMSATEPKITLRFEARQPDGLRPVIERFLAPAPKLLAKVIDELDAEMELSGRE